MPDAPDRPTHEADSVVFEPVTRLDGTVAPPSPRQLWRRQWRAWLARPGAIALIEGLALLGGFSLPWYAMLINPSPPVPILRSPELWLSGWRIAAGFPLSGFADRSPTIPLFAHLWLIPLVAASLLVLAVWQVRGHVTPGLAAALIIALSALAALVAAGYVAQITAIGNFGDPAGPPAYRVLYGCWLTLGVTIVAVAVAIRALVVAARPARSGPTS